MSWTIVRPGSFTVFFLSSTTSRLEIFVVPVEQTVRIRTGETNESAL